MNWTAAIRALLGGADGSAPDLRSPAHIISAATRKANERALRRETTSAMRAHLIKVGKLRA